MVGVYRNWIPAFAGMTIMTLIICEGNEIATEEGKKWDLFREITIAVEFRIGI
jgi:hypothetical protein